MTSLAVAILGGGLVWWIAGQLLRPVPGLLEGPLARLAAPVRLRLLSALALLPLLAGTASALLLQLPALGGLWITRHCHPGIGCAPHHPAAIAEGGGPLLAAAAGTLLLAAGWRAARLFTAHRRRQRQLRQLARRQPDGFGLIDSDEVFAVTAGLLRPEVYVSEGMRTRLDALQMRSLLAHEASHVAHRDNLRLALLAGVMPAALAGPASGLMRALRRALEVRCDAEAARRLRDPLLIAATLLRARPRPSSAETPSGGGALSARVGDLLHPPQPTPGLSPLILLLFGVLLLASTALGGNLAHHGAEWVQTLLAAAPQPRG